MTATTENGPDSGNTTETVAAAPPRVGVGEPAQSSPHVVIIVQNLPVPLDRRVWLECRALRAAGYEVSVVCPKGDGDPSYHVIDGVHIYKYEPPPDATGTSGFAYEFAYCFARTAALITKVARRRKIDAVQACNPPDTFFALAAPMKALTGARFVFDQHDLCPEVYASRFAHRHASSFGRCSCSRRAPTRWPTTSSRPTNRSSASRWPVAAATPTMSRSSEAVREPRTCAARNPNQR